MILYEEELLKWKQNLERFCIKHSYLIVIDLLLLKILNDNLI
jgi:hypothetical protein